MENLNVGSVEQFAQKRKAEIASKVSQAYVGVKIVERVFEGKAEATLAITKDTQLFEADLKHILQSVKDYNDCIQFGALSKKLLPEAPKSADKK